MKQLLVLSGKGGTGKTTITTAFIKLSNAEGFADCDIDAPNLHLMIKSSNEEKKDFFAMEKAQIDQSKCIKCGLCFKHCQFDAVSKEKIYMINPYSCEGCGVCEKICPVNAVSLKPAKSGDLILYKDKNFTFSTAELKAGSGHSGMLVSEVKKRLKQSADNVNLAVIDGSPGIGCPVIASITGVDIVLIVAEPSLSGISDMERIIKTAQKLNTKTAVCINKFDINLENTQKIETFCKENNIPFMGKIPFDNNVGHLINKGKTILESSSVSAEAVKDIYKNTIELL